MAATTTTGISQVTIGIEHEGSLGRAFLTTKHLHASGQQCFPCTLPHSTAYHHVNLQSSKEFHQHQMTHTLVT